jgi:hypothetical protein
VVRLLTQWIAVLLAGGLLASAYAQYINLEPGLDGDQPLPTVTFEWTSPGVLPAHYAITVDSSGRTAYLSDEMGPGEQKETQTGTPYLLDFVISNGTTESIFALARQAGYFTGNFENEAHRPGDAPFKTFRYSEGPPDWSGHWTQGVRNETSFDYTNNPAMQQLATLFEQLAATVQLGRRLDYLHQADPAALAKEIEQASALADQRQLLELPAIAESLRSIADDSTLPSPTRQGARNLLALAERQFSVSVASGQWSAAALSIQHSAKDLV